MADEKSMNSKKEMKGWPRAAGVLMPIFSLPGKYGIGTLGKEAYKFADFLSESGQRYWQILPVGPTGYGDSPYQSFSTFAGNPYFIDLEKLIAEGLLTEEECDSFDFGEEEQKISYGKLYNGRYPLLKKAYDRFLERKGNEGEDYQQFLSKNSFWLEAYADFRREKLPYPGDYFRFLQYEFFKQWQELKNYVNEKGIEIIGDIPIYVSLESSDVRTDPKLFQLDENFQPTMVAGCPPDAFSESGQLWGNPLYDWQYHKKTGYAWWIQRMKHCFTLYDIVRVDHFRGFDEYYAIPYGDVDAKRGCWEKGPGIDLFRALKQALGEDKRIIAEDLGYVTDSVKKLVRDSGYPGMKILEFAFDSREESDYRPETWPENSVGYTGTHDNQTLKTWLLEISEEDRQEAAHALNCSVKEMMQSDYVSAFIRMALNSRSNTVIIPLQDYMELDGSARINAPSTMGENWRYRFKDTDFTAALQKYIEKLTKESGRWGKKS